VTRRGRTLGAYAWRWFRAMAMILAIVCAAWLVAVAAVPFPVEVLAERPDLSTQVLDRHGQLLHDIPSRRGTRARWVALDRITPHLRHAFIAAEDQRFETHIGLDPLALLRAVGDRLGGAPHAGGASTLTQQLVKRVMMSGRPRNLATKVDEALYAMRLEAGVPKTRILEEYINRVDFGNQLVGVESAALAYFGRSALQLSPAQAAFLAALPNAPHHLNPRRFPDRARQRAHHVLHRMHEDGYLSDTDLRIALAEPLQLEPSPAPLVAPWLTTRLIDDLKRMDTPPNTVRTTLDATLQRLATTLVANPQQHFLQGMPDARAGRHQAAMVILSTPTSEVLAWAGSRDWHDTTALGRTDAITALRQPGSALKPFIYAMLLESGATAETLLDDAPASFATRHGTYRPQNFDRRFRGRVTLAEALGSSLNIPAVHAAEKLGIANVLERLRALGLGSLAGPADHYGPGLALGAGEVRLIDLAAAYATLGRLGRARPWRWLESDAISSDVQVFSPEAAFGILEILADDRHRGIGFGRASAMNMPFRVAMKTGTSSDRRDNVAVGVTPDYTVAVWVGHFDGSAVNTADAHLSAAPLLRAAFQQLYPHAARPADVRWYRAMETSASIAR
jgi:penicillin-binding protein 1C